MPPPATSPLAVARETQQHLQQLWLLLPDTEEARACHSAVEDGLQQLLAFATEAASPTTSATRPARGPLAFPLTLPGTPALPLHSPAVPITPCKANSTGSDSLQTALSDPAPSADSNHSNVSKSPTSTPMTQYVGDQNVPLPAVRLIQLILFITQWLHTLTSLGSSGKVYWHLLLRALPRSHRPSRYNFREVIGHGACSQVHRAVHRTSRKAYAIKTVDRGLVGDRMWATARQEAVILKHLRHPHIVQVFECIEGRSHLYIVMELLAGGELFDQICRLTRYTEALAAKLIRNLLSATRYMHQSGVVHRDIKPENIMLSRRPSTDDDTDWLTDIRLVDFGFAARCAPGEEVLRDVCGTPEYVAPEVISTWRGQRIAYGQSCDLWAVGAVAYVLLSGHEPFYAKTEDDVLQRVCAGDFQFAPQRVWESVSETAQDFVRRLLVVDPAERMTAEEALRHPWLLDPDRQPERHLSDSQRLLRALSAGGMRGVASMMEQVETWDEDEVCLLPLSLPNHHPSAATDVT
eukprot:EG_transcript_6237